MIGHNSGAFDWKARAFFMLLEMQEEKERALCEAADKLVAVRDRVAAMSPTMAHQIWPHMTARA